MVELEVGKEVAHEFCAFHAEWLDSVAAPPMSQHSVLTIDQLCVECYLVFTITHPGSEGCPAVNDVNVNGAIQAGMEVDRDFDVLIGVRGRDVE